MDKHPMKKMKKKIGKKAKNNFLIEMADDFVDIVTNAKLYKKLIKKK